MKLRQIACAMAPLAILAACSGSNEDESGGQGTDPAVDAALNENLATDPDLSRSNESDAALSGTGNQGVPTIDTSQRAVQAAQDRAAQLVGGRENLHGLPSPTRLGAADNVTQPMQQAAQRIGQNATCFEGVSYSTAWAARLPGEFPVYPRGNTQEAAGNDEGSCAVRAVSFKTPVPVGQVFSFYAARARDAGYSVDYTIVGNENVLSGVSGQSAYTIYARKGSDGVTEVDLTTSKR